MRIFRSDTDGVEHFPSSVNRVRARRGRGRKKRRTVPSHTCDARTVLLQRPWCGMENELERLEMKMKKSVGKVGKPVFYGERTEG